MDIKDFCKVYFTGTPIATAPTYGLGTDPVEIVSGRVAVHGLFASSWSRGATQFTVQDSRPYYLCGSADEDDKYLEFIPLANITVDTSDVFSYNMGGNGLLFPDGVFLGKSATASDGSAARDTLATLTILYTGGANT